MLKPRTLLSSLFSLSILSVLVALKYGAVAISYTHFYNIGLDPQNLYHQIIVSLRLPRVATAFITGGLLALAGVLLQVLLCNPLADPYVLGISGGAAVVTLLMMSFGMSVVFQTGGAIAGALLAILLVFFLTRCSGVWSPTRLLLIGVIIASGFSAAISLILTLSPDSALHGMLFWLLGDLSYGEFPWLALLVLLFGLFCSLFWSPQLNVFSYGEKQAKSLGVDYQRLSFKIYFLSALLTATAVSIAGTIGFIGLIVPHMIRALGGYDHRYLIPGAVLLGGSLLTIADTIARTVIAPEELPVGVIIALIGAPVFLYLLLRGDTSRR